METDVNKITKQPSYRFAGYTEAWEQRKLGEVGTTYTGLSGKTKEDFGHGNGKFVTYMNVFSNAVGVLDMTEAVELIIVKTKFFLEMCYLLHHQKRLRK